MAGFSRNKIIVALITFCSVMARCRGESIDPYNCAKSFPGTTYNEGVGKCIRKYEYMSYVNPRCNVWNSTVLQCGLEGMACLEGACKCVDEDHIVVNNGLTCLPGQHHGEKCHPETSPCKRDYDCGGSMNSSGFGFCQCKKNSRWSREIGIWNETDSLCYSDFYCNTRIRGTFYETQSKSCKYKLREIMFSRKISNTTEVFSIEALCPLFSKLTSLTNGDLTCDCVDQRKNVDSKACVQEKSYGEPCNPNLMQLCPQTTLCLDGNCACNSSTQVWNPTNNQCKLKSGAPCDGRTNQNDCNTYSTCRYRYTNNEHRYTCVCNTGYTEMEDGRCVGEYRSSCKTNNECNVDKGLECVQNVCVYNSTRSFCQGQGAAYDDENAKCIQPVTINYNNRYNCGNWNSSLFQCGYEGMICEDGRCKCNQGLVSTGDKLRCLQGMNYSEPCDHQNKPCNNLYECSTPDLKCRCKYNGVWNEHESLCYSTEYCQERWGGYSGVFYEEGSAKCKYKVNQPIHVWHKQYYYIQESSICPFNSILEVEPNMIRYTKEENYLRCVCKPDYTNNYNNTSCFRGKQLGESCAPAIETDALLGNPCVYRSYSRCLNGTCACTPDEYFDYKDQSCRIKVRNNCRPSLDHVNCVRYATCKESTTDRDSYKCECIEPYVENYETGNCVGNYMSVCIGSSDCMSMFGCVDGKCKCVEMGKEIYNSTIGLCVGLVGAPCNSTNSNQCVENSYCNPNSEICECNDGYKTILGNNKKCFKLNGYHEVCQASDCDFTKGLACVNQTCTCLNSQLNYNNTSGECLAPLGATCGDYETLDKDCDPKHDHCEYYVVGCEAPGICKEIGNTDKEFICVASNDDKGEVDNVAKTPSS